MDCGLLLLLVFVAFVLAGGGAVVVDDDDDSTLCWGGGGGAAFPQAPVGRPAEEEVVLLFGSDAMVHGVVCLAWSGC